MKTLIKMHLNTVIFFILARSSASSLVVLVILLDLVFAVLDAIFSNFENLDCVLMLPRKDDTTCAARAYN